MRNKKIVLSFLVFFFLIILSNICLAKDLDKINKYYITVDPRSDGSLDMTYYIDWEVLDSDSAGPLEWVQIGVPNSNIDLVQAISSNIKSVKYSSNGGDYIRVDFKQPYYKGEVVSFSFSFHQSYMYDIKEDLAKYKFTPGWFDDIEVKEIMVFWKAEDVFSANSKKINEDNYYVWKDSLRKGGKLKVDVSYSRYVRNFDTSKQDMYATKFNSSNNDSVTKNTSLIGVVFFILIAISIISSLTSGYSSHRGYYDRGYRRHSHHHHSSCASSCACVSSCACACACAGGGRVGCSKKDFYGTTIRTKMLNKVIKK